MKTEKKNKRERLDFFRSLYESSKNAYSDTLDEFEKNMAQYRGSPKFPNLSNLPIKNLYYELTAKATNNILRP